MTCKSALWTIVFLAVTLPGAAQEPQGAPVRPVVGQAVRFSVSPPLRDLPPVVRPGGEASEEGRPGPENPSLPREKFEGASHRPAEEDPLVQAWPGLNAMPAPLRQWEGISNRNGVYPPDTEGDVGPNHYVQWVNLSFQVWDKNGNSLFGPVDGNTLWQALGGPCFSSNDGDPIVLYDSLADRWFMSQFIIPGPYYQAIAVSATPDPLGSWYLYCFEISATKMNDYPKFGVWPDGYYMTVNQFVNGSAWGGAGVVVFDRQKMLAGDPAASFQYFDVGAVDLSFGGMLPSHTESKWNAPAAGTPNFIMEVDDDTWIPGYAHDALRIWECHVDWDTPANSTLGLASFQPNQVLDVSPFTVLCPSTRSCIPQPGTGVGLDDVADRLMYRLNYRNRGSYESAVVNFTVDAGSGRAGIRWFELRRLSGAWSLYQEGTFAPADTEHRWMGSAASDHVGNLAVGYSVSSASVYPSIRYAGRLAGDPPNELTQGEATLIAGSGSQTGTANRWGDYSTLSVDPTDDCTFWYTQEYVATTGTSSWQTRVGAFKFPNCAMGPQGTLRGTVTHGVTGAPVAGATVTATSSSVTVPAVTASDGSYTMTLPEGTYDVTVSAWGFSPSGAAGVAVTGSSTTTRDFALTPLALHALSGVVTDAATGWPLYASVAVAGYPSSPLWTDPLTGAYQVSLPAGGSYSLTVTPWVPGYTPEAATVGPLTAPTVRNFALDADRNACTAPGYGTGNGTVFFTEGFEGATPPALPAGWTQVDVNGTEGNWATSTQTVHPSGVPPHGGSNLAYFNSWSAHTGNDTRLVRTSGINLSSSPNAVLTFWMYHESGYSASDDRLQVQVSTDGGATWQNVGSPVSRYAPASGWQRHEVPLTGITGNLADVRIGLLGVSEYGNDIHIDDVEANTGCAAPSSGGLVVGNVYDANTGAFLPGALVQNVDRGTSAAAAATADPAVGDAFYCLYSDGNDAMEASKGTSYQAVSANPSVAFGAVVEQDFHLPAGQLSVSPSPLNLEAQPGAAASATVTLTNGGGRDVHFQVTESAFSPVKPSQSPRLPYKLKYSPYWDQSETAPRGALEKTPNAWSAGSAIPTGPRYRCASVSPDGRYLYLFGGADASGTVLAESWRYDTQADAWQRLADMPVALMNMAAAYLNGNIYLVGGYTGDAHTNYFLIYSIAGDSWTTSTWPAARTPMVAASGGKLYAFGGNPGPSAETRSYDPVAGTWSGPLAPMPAAVTYGSAVAAGDSLYVIGGSNAGGAVAAVQRYDPASNAWSAAGPALPQGRMSAGAALYGNLLYVSGGGGAGGNLWAPYGDTLTLDPSLWPSGSWQSQGEALPTPVVAPACACAGNRLVLAGGATTDTTYDATQLLDDGKTCPNAADVPWLSVAPVSGTVPAGGHVDLSVNASAASLGNGLHHAWLILAGDTPYPGLTLPVNFTVGYGPVTAAASASSTSGTAPLTVNFTGTASGGDGGPYTYDWNFGDGSAHSSLQNPSHTYASAGTFPVTFTATDGHGNSGADTHLSVTVTAAPPVVSSVSQKTGPWRLILLGSNFHNPCTVKVNGVAKGTVTWKSATKLVAKGADLKAACPKGTTVQITVTNNDDGGTSTPVPFTR